VMLSSPAGARLQRAASDEVDKACGRGHPGKEPSSSYLTRDCVECRDSELSTTALGILVVSKLDGCEAKPAAGGSTITPLPFPLDEVGGP
jgi:hypothetical protein